MKKHKLKINENTTLKDIREELDYLKNAKIQTVPLTHIRKIIQFIGAKEVPATGSSIRFYHDILLADPFFNGYFQAHKVHKGGNKDEIRKRDYVKYLYTPLVLIIEYLENE